MFDLLDQDDNWNPSFFFLFLTGSNIAKRVVTFSSENVKTNTKL